MILNICEDFTETPGARNREDGKYSGQEFFEDFLKPRYLGLSEHETLTIILDNTDGFPTSFLDQSFGALAREYSFEEVIKKIKFISKEDPYLIEEIINYMKGV